VAVATSASTSLFRLAAVRACRHDVVEAIDLVVAPVTPIGARAARAAGLTADELAEGLPPRQALDRFRRFVGRSTIVAYIAEPQRELVSREFERNGSRPPPGRWIDLDSLLAKATDGPRKPALSAYARAAGISLPRRGHAPSEAMAIARLATSVIESCDGRALTDRPPSWLESVNDAPDGPGVYVFRDAVNLVLYVGRAGNLRQRLMTYRSSSLAMDRELDGLRARAASIQTRQTHSDLEARVLEAELIRDLAPPFNTQLRRRLPRLFVALDPRPRAVTAPPRDSSAWRGPFASGSWLAGVLRVCHAIDSPIAIINFLDGDADPLLDHVASSMRDAAAHGDARAVDCHRRSIREIRSLHERRSDRALAPGASYLAIEAMEGATRHRAHLIDDRRLVGSTWLRTVEPSTRTVRQRVRSLRVTATERVVDTRAVVCEWLATAPPALRLIEVPAPTPSAANRVRSEQLCLALPDSPRPAPSTTGLPPPTPSVAG
jgi:DNA polymerase III epsilon subunit-like protein